MISRSPHHTAPGPCKSRRLRVTGSGTGYRVKVWLSILRPATRVHGPLASLNPVTQPRQAMRARSGGGAACKACSSLLRFALVTLPARRRSCGPHGRTASAPPVQQPDRRKCQVVDSTGSLRFTSAPCRPARWRSPVFCECVICCNMYRPMLWPAQGRAAMPACRRRIRPATARAPICWISPAVLITYCLFLPRERGVVDSGKAGQSGLSDIGRW